MARIPDEEIERLKEEIPLERLAEPLLVPVNGAKVSQVRKLEPASTTPAGPCG